jgi:thiamine pyrophosphokinase
MKRSNSRALLLCNGEPPPRRLLRQIADDIGYVVAADGGANVARRYGIRLRAIVGDLDSILPATRRHYASTLQLRIRRQDNTDLEKALDFILAQGFRHVVICGSTGRRVDFTLANVSILWRYSRRIHVELVGDGWRAYPVESRCRMKAKRGTTVSIIPFGACRGVTLRGLKYPLRNATLTVGQVGVSNVVAADSFSVTIRQGRALLLLLDQQSRKRR